MAGKNRYFLFNSEQDEKAIYKHGRLTEIESALNQKTIPAVLSAKSEYGYW